MLEGLQDIITDRPIQPQTDQELQKELSNTSDKPDKKPKSIFMDIRINADNQSSCQIACYWIILIAAIIIVSLLTGLALPSSIISIDQMESLKGTTLEGCSNSLLIQDSKLICGSSTSLTQGQFVTGLESLNQFLVFYLHLNSNSRLQKNIKFRLYRILRERPGDDDSVVLSIQKLIKQEDVEIESRYFNQDKFYLNYVNDIQSGEEYYWEVELDRNFILLNSPIQLQSFVINPQYSLFCILLRLAFLLISVIFLVISTKKFFTMDPTRILPEQKIILFLSAVTITFNDPFYIGTILSPSSFTSFLSTFFTWNFLTTLIVVWVFFLQRIKDEEGQIQTQLKTCPNITLIVLFYLADMIFRVGLAFQQTHNRPFTDPNLIRDPVISSAFVISTIFFLVTLVYIFYLYCQLWGRLQLMWRNTLFINLSFFFFLIVLYLFIIGGFDVFEYSASTVMVTYTSTNLFSYYLQYMYMPSNNEQQGPEKGLDKEIGEFDLTDISIELQYEGYDIFREYGVSRLSDEEENKAGKSYLGENIKMEGSKVITLKEEEKKQDTKNQEEKIQQQQVKEKDPSAEDQIQNIEKKDSEASSQKGVEKLPIQKSESEV